MKNLWQKEKSMYEPKVRDVVTMGRHGQPMSVRKVYPISRTAVVCAMDARRFIVDWHEMRPDGWTRELMDDVQEVSA